MPRKRCVSTALYPVCMFYNKRLPTKTEENHETAQSGKPVCRPRILSEFDIFIIRGNLHPVGPELRRAIRPTFFCEVSFIIVRF